MQQLLLRWFMLKIFSHIAHYKRLCIFLAAVLFVEIGLGQDDVKVDTVTTVTIDSSYTDEDESEDVIAEFNKLMPTDTARYQALHIHDSTMERLRSDDAFWYANIAPKQPKKKEDKPTEYGESFYQKKWFRTLVWILVIGGFLAVLIWFLIASDVKLFRKKATTIYQDVEGDLPEDIFSIDYENELRKAMAAENLRLSIRLMFLHILKMMSEKELIRYKAERTNSDYLMELWNTSYYNDFFKLTRHFEYVWYGKFEISKEAFQFVQTEYNQLKQKLA